MALLKKVLVLKAHLLLVLAVIAIADARLDLLKLQTTKNNAYVLSQPGKQAEDCEWPSCCNDCECKKESGKTECECFDLKINGVPPSCKSAICVLMEPAYCRCLDITETCYPKCFLDDSSQL